jgi:hypothetical protein
MTADSPTPLASADDFTAGAFADLAQSYESDALDQIMIDATRACESESTRRLAPFTITETHRASGTDPDEYTDGGNLPLDLVGTVGRSYAMSLGASTMIRHCWLNEYAPIFPDMWVYSDVQVTIVRSYGGTEVLTVNDFEGPEPDSGHLWFKLGKFIPAGSLIRVRYSGGYAPTPADLRRASMYMAASIICREIDPLGQSHGRSPDALEALALSWLHPYARA